MDIITGRAPPSHAWSWSSTHVGTKKNEAGVGEGRIQSEHHRPSLHILVRFAPLHTIAPMHRAWVWDRDQAREEGQAEGGIGQLHGNVTNKDSVATSVYPVLMSS